MEHPSLPQLIAAIRDGSLVPVLGPGTLDDVVHRATGQPMPAESDELIIALNNGKPMAPKLMYEFARAAMHVEFRRGRQAVVRFLFKLYTDPGWSRPTLHELVTELRPAYIIDLNRDTNLQRLWADRPHTLVVGTARLGGGDFRFRLYCHDGAEYRKVGVDSVDPALPVLFKPLGTALPQPHFIASDADYVDYITELMGGFAIPDFLKTRRKGLKYLFLGMRFSRDTERMLISELIYGAGEPAGWALLPDPSTKEAKYCARQGIGVIEVQHGELLAAIRQRAVA